MNAPHSVPLKASTYGRCKDLTVTIAQCQWTKCIWRSNDSSIVIDVGGFGYKYSSAYSKMFRDSSSLQQVLVGIEKEQGAFTFPKPPAHLQTPYGIPSVPGAESFFNAMSSSNSASFFFSLLFLFLFLLTLALALSDDCCHLLFRHCWKV